MKGMVLLARTRTIRSFRQWMSSLPHTTDSPDSMSNAWMAKSALERS